jgi:ABC-type sulfate transport system permease component
MALILLIGTPTAYLIGTRRFRGPCLAVTLVELPLVLPPAVAGIGLLAAFAASACSETRSTGSACRSPSRRLPS